VNAKSARVIDEAISVALADGREISAPLAWYPRLLHATAEERENLPLIGDSEGIHWPDLDEYLSIDNLIAGRPSGESQSSFKHWLEQRSA
jgi:hypothetical protein